MRSMQLHTLLVLNLFFGAGAVGAPATTVTGTAAALPLVELRVQTKIFGLNRTSLQQNETAEEYIKVLVEAAIARSLGDRPRQTETRFVWGTDVRAIETTFARPQPSQEDLKEAEELLPLILQGKLDQLRNRTDFAIDGGALTFSTPRVTIVVGPTVEAPLATGVVAVVSSSATLLVVAVLFLLYRRRFCCRGAVFVGDHLAVLTKADRIMISARFNSAERKGNASALNAALERRGFRHVRHVEVGPGESFGPPTMHYLTTSQVMIALVTDDYAEETNSRYCSYWELKHCHENLKDSGSRQFRHLVAVRLCQRWPPEPPGQSGKDLCRMAFSSNLVYIDPPDHRFDAEFIAEQIAKRTTTTL